MNSGETYDEPSNSAGDHPGVPMDVDPRPFVHASHVASSSNSIINNHVSVEAHRDHSLRLVEDNFYRSKQTGIRVSVFHPNEESVRRLACLHGLSSLADDNRSVEIITRQLIHHIIHGHCCTIKGLSGVEQERRTACAEISKGFDDVRHLSDCIVDSFLLYKDDMSKLPLRKLIAIVDALDYPRSDTVQDIVNRNSRRDAIQRLKTFRSTVRTSEAQVRDIFSAEFETMSRPVALSFARNHGIPVDHHHKKDEIKDMIIEHFVHGRCMNNVVIAEDHLDASSMLCGNAVSEFIAQTDIPSDPALFNLFALSKGVNNISLKGARRLAKMIGIACDQSDGKSALKGKICRWIKQALKGKGVITSTHPSDDLKSLIDTRHEWPQVVGTDLKAKICALFKELTGKQALASVTCASCSESTPKKTARNLSVKDVDLTCLT